MAASLRKYQSHPMTLVSTSQAPISPGLARLYYAYTIIDFADFASAPSPIAVSIPVAPADNAAAAPTAATVGGQYPYTKWYRVWERASPADFKTEMYLLPLLIVAILVHVWGTRANKSKARKWMAVHAPVLESEYAIVGYKGRDTTSSLDGISGDLLKVAAAATESSLKDGRINEKSHTEYQGYATGRANAAFTDLKLSLTKKSNPALYLAEQGLALFFESMTAPREHYEVVTYLFDGKEKEFVPARLQAEHPIQPTSKSTYDPFVFAIVHKLSMRRLRDERYDISLTFTKDHAKLPAGLTVMSESAEVTEAMLTKELIDAVTKAGDAFEYLIITDQPIDKPNKLDEVQPRKRAHLSLKIPSGQDYTNVLPLFQTFLRLPDHLISAAHFRPEVNKKIAALRDGEIKKLKKVSEDEASEERRTASEKIKKEERDRKLKGLSAEEQRKFLAKETERDQKRREKKMTKRG